VGGGWGGGGWGWGGGGGGSGHGGCGWGVKEWVVVWWEERLMFFELREMLDWRRSIGKVVRGWWKQMYAARSGRVVENYRRRQVRGNVSLTHRIQRALDRRDGMV